MQRLIEQLRDRSTLPWWIALSVVSIAFVALVLKLGDSQFLLDSELTATQARATLELLTEEQRNIHFWLTLVADSFLPAIYCTLLAAYAMKSGCSPKALLLPVLALILDYVENVIQLVALAGDDSWLSLKPWVTPQKFLAIILSIAWTVWSWQQKRPSDELGLDRADAQDS